MPYDFFLSRYTEAYVSETVAFCEALVKDEPVPCTGEDGLVALIMSIAADKSAAENRWVTFQVSFHRCRAVKGIDKRWLCFFLTF